MSLAASMFNFSAKGDFNMKTIRKLLLHFLLFTSLICNILFAYFLFQEAYPSCSIIKFNYKMHDTVIYCEKTDKTTPVKLDYNRNIFEIGNSKLIYEDDSVYLVNPEEKIKLSDYEGSGVIINSDGEILYILNTPKK